MGKFDFVKDFVEQSMKFEDFDDAQLIFFKSQVTNLGIEVGTLDEKRFNEINDELHRIYEEIMKVTNNNNLNEEEIIMKTNKVTAAVEEMMEKMAQAKENIKCKGGETYEEFIDKTDDSLNVMKGALGNTLSVLDDILGYTLIKDAVLDMIDASMDKASSKKDLFKMARKCRELIEKEIETLEFWGDEESFKKAVQLKALTEGDRGKSIFESFAVGVIWIAKKVTRKLHKWFNVDDEKSVMSSVCKSIAGFARVVRAGVKIAWNAAKFAASFVIAGVIKIADFIVHAIKSVVNKIKDWSIRKNDTDTIDNDDFFDDDFEEEVI